MATEDGSGKVVRGIVSAVVVLYIMNPHPRPSSWAIIPKLRPFVPQMFSDANNDIPRIQGFKLHLIFLFFFDDHPNEK